MGWGRGHWSSLPGRLQAQRVPLGRWSLLGPRALKEYVSFPEVCAFLLEPVGGSYVGHREVRKLRLVTRILYLLLACPVSSTEAKEALLCAIQKSTRTRRTPTNPTVHLYTFQTWGHHS